MDLSRQGQHHPWTNNHNGPTTGSSPFRESSRDEQRLSGGGGLFCSRSSEPSSFRFGVAPQPRSIASHIGKSQVEEMVSTSMSRLSAPDREQRLNELHGVEEETDESPQKLEQMLQEMDSILAARKEAQLPGIEAIILAELQDHAFVMGLRLKFIRATRYDVSEAATRLISFLSVKLKLFGYDKLTSKITLSDLSEEAMEILNSGLFQVMPFPDSVGRFILVVNPVMVRHAKTQSGLVSLACAHKSGSAGK